LWGGDPTIRSDLTKNSKSEEKEIQKEASYIKDETITEVGEYSTSMEFESSFYGAAHIGTVSKSAKTSEDYIGDFSRFGNSCKQRGCIQCSEFRYRDK
jgi:hypothetical protein